MTAPELPSEETPGPMRHLAVSPQVVDRPAEPIGARLRRLRTGQELSQTQLALKSGIPKSRLSRYENGHLLPSIPTLLRLASALEAPSGALLDDPRAPYEAFASELARRGVQIESIEHARELAGRVADLLEDDERRSTG